MSGVWWLNVVRFRRFARAIVRPEKKKNNKDSTEIRKTIKDSNVLESFNYAKTPSDTTKHVYCNYLCQIHRKQLSHTHTQISRLQMLRLVK